MATPLENNYLSNFDLEYLLGPASTIDSIGENAGLSNYVNQENNVHEISLPLQVDNEEPKLKRDYESLKIHCAKLENDHDSLKNDYKGLKKDYAKLALDYASLQKENREHAMASINNAKNFDNMELQANQYLSTINKLQKQCELYEINIASQESNIKQFQCLVQELTTTNEDLKKNIKSEKVTVRDGRKMISTLNNNIETLTEHLCLLGCVIQGRKKLDKDIRRYVKKYCKKNTSPKEIEERFECKSIDTGRGSSLAFSDGDRSFYSPAYSCNFSPLSTCSTILRNDQAKQMKDACSSPLPLSKSIDKSTSPIIFEAIDRPVKNTSDMSTSPIFEHSKSPETRLNDYLMPVSPISSNETRTPMLPASTAELTLNPECVEAVKIQPKVTEMPRNLQQTSKTYSHPICKEDKAPQHMTKSLSHKAKDSLLEEADKTPRHNIETVKKATTDSFFNLISNSLFDETAETPKCMAKKPDDSKSSKLGDELKIPRHTTDISKDATYSIFGEDPEMPQYIAQKSDNATNSTSVKELKNPRQTTVSSKKIIKSIFDEDSDYLKQTDLSKKSGEPTILVKGAKSPWHSSNTANTGTISDKGPKTPLHRDYTSVKPSSISSKTINEEKSLQKTSKTIDSVYLKNSVEVIKQTYGKVTDPLKIPYIPQKLMLDNEVITQHSTEIPQVTSVFGKESEISQAMKRPNIPGISMLDNKVKPLHSTEIPQITLSVFDEESEISQTMKMPDLVSPLYSEKANETAQHTNEISKIPPTFIEIAKSPPRTSETPTIYTSPMTENSLSRSSSAASYYSTDYEDRTSPLTLSECPNNATALTLAEDKMTSATDMTSKISGKLNEIDSQTDDNLQDDNENNLEIEMILDKHRFNLKMISPMSITPEPDQENESSTLENEVSADKNQAPKTLSPIPKISSQTLHRSDERPNEYKIDKESRCKSRKESQSDHTSRVNSRNQQQIRELKNINKNDNVDTSHKLSVSDPSHQISAKNPGMINNKKLSGLQKQYEINVPKQQVNTSSLQKHLRWTPYPIPVVSQCPENISLNKENAKKIMAELKEKQLSKEKVTKGKGSIASCDQNMPLIPTEPNPGSVPNTEFGIRNKTKPKLQSGLKIEQLAVSSQANDKHDLNVSQNTSSCPKNTEKLEISNVECKPQTQATTLFETKPRRSSQLSIESQSTSTRGLRHTPIIAPVQTLPKNSEHLPESNKMPSIPTQAGPGSVPNTEFGIRIKTKPKLQTGLKIEQLAVSSQANDKHELNVSQNTSCPNNTERLEISNVVCKPQNLAKTLFETSPRSSQLSIESQTTLKRGLRHTPIIAPVQTLPKTSEHLPESNKMPSIPTQADPGSVPNTEFGIRIQTKPKLQSGQKIEQLAVTSQASDKHELSVSKNPSSCSKNTERLQMSNMKCRPQTQATTLFKTSSGRSSQLSIESQSTRNRQIRHTPIIAPVQILPKNSEHLPESNKMPSIPTQAGPGSVPNTEFGIHIKTKPKLQSGLKLEQLAVSSQANDKHELNVSQNTSCPNNTERLEISNVECKPQTLATTLSETSPRRSSQLSIESQTTRKRGLCHTPIIAPVQTLPKTSEHLPESNKMPSIPTQAGPGSVPNTEFGIHIKTKPKLQSGQKIEQLAVTSRANDKHELNVSQNTERLEISNVECKLQTQATTLFETSPRRSSQISIESQLTSTRGLRHTPIIAPVQTLPKNSEHLPESNNMPSIPTQAGPGSVPNTEFGIRIQTKPELQPGQKIEQLAVTSRANDKHELNVSQNTSSCPKNTEKLETSPRRSSQLSIESQSTRKRGLRHTPIIAPVQMLPKNSEHLPESNKCPPPLPILTKSLPEIGTRGSRLYSEIQIHNAKISQPKSKELRKEAETNIHSISATHIVLPQTDNNTTNEIRGKTNPEEIDYFESPPSKKIRISHMPLEKSRDSGIKRRLCMSPQQDDQSKKSNLQIIDIDCNNKNKSSVTSNIPETELDRHINSHTPILLNKSVPEQTRHCADYNDINLFLSDSDDVSPKESKKPAKNLIEVKDILSTMLEKYASVTHGPYKKAKEDPNLKNLVIKIESGVSKCAKCHENPEEYKKAIDEFVCDVKSQDTKNFVNGLIKYLNNPARKAELPKNIKPKAPPIITPSEKTLIDVIIEIQGSNYDIVNDILDNIELTLFMLDRGATPVFEIIESMAHFFAAICSYYKNVSRLRMFMLNALYCISFKAMPLIKQCLDVFPTALPYGDTVIAKSPLIRCFVFMLHFYACDDPFKRVQELRDRLKYKYNYNLVEENESTILFMFKSAIDQLTENKRENDMLRISLIVLAKRRGTSWCHKNIIQKILLPMISGQIPVSDTGKRFCILLLGPLLKPYNKEMMVHREEVITLLTNMLMESQRHELKEDILTSLITLDTPTTWETVNKYLIQWTPPAISPAFEDVLKRYIRKRHVSKWKGFYLKYYSEI